MTRPVSLTVRGREAWHCWLSWRPANGDVRQSTILALGGAAISMICAGSASTSKRSTSRTKAHSPAVMLATCFGRASPELKIEVWRHEACCRHLEARRRGFCLAGTPAAPEAANDHGRHWGRWQG